MSEEPNTTDSGTTGTDSGTTGQDPADASNGATEPASAPADAPAEQSSAPADAPAEQSSAPANGAGGPQSDDVWEALEEVIDPELGLDFVSLGLVYNVEIEGPEVFITFTLTTPACPIGPQVSEQMREFVGDLDGVEKVHPKMIFDPPWSPEKMSEDAKFALGY